MNGRTRLGALIARAAPASTEELERMAREQEAIDREQFRRRAALELTCRLASGFDKRRRVDAVEQRELARIAVGIASALVDELERTEPKPDAH